MVKSLRTLLVLSALFALSACGLNKEQREGIAAFGKATEGLGAAVSEALTASRDDMRDLSYANLATMRLSNAATQSRFARYLERPDGIFSGVDGAKRLADRIRAAEVLSTYGTLLASLASDTRKTEIEAAASDLKGALKALPSDIKMLDDSDLDIFGEAVVAFGSLIVDQKKAQAIRRIVPNADEAIGKLADLLAREFHSPDSGDRQSISSQLDVIIFDATTFSEDALKDPSGLRLADRRVVADTLRRARSADARMKAGFPPLVDALQKARDAHTKIAEGLKTDKVDQAAIRAFSDAVSAAIKLARQSGK